MLHWMTNATKLSTLVVELSKTQFIFITHNKISMEIADQLVGVTERAGVSRIVSRYRVSSLIYRERFCAAGLIWLDSLWTGVGEAGVFALVSFGILSIAVICDYLLQKKLSYKFTRRFFPAKTRGEKPETPLDLYECEPDARYECIIKFLILGGKRLTYFQIKRIKERIGSKRVFILSSSNNTQTSNSRFNFYRLS